MSEKLTEAQLATALKLATDTGPWDGEATLLISRALLQQTEALAESERRLGDLLARIWRVMRDAS